MFQNVNKHVKTTKLNIRVSFRECHDAVFAIAMNSSRRRTGATLKAGAAVVDLTPPASVFLHGYPHVPRFSTGVHDPLQCAALFLRGGQGPGALFLANDLIVVGNRLVSEVRRRIGRATGLPEEAIMVTATHTHSGPITVNFLSNASDPVVPKADEGYLEWVAGRMVDAACAAVQAAVPAEIGLAKAQAAGVGTNRHDPLGPSDPEVPVLLARSIEGQVPIGCMVVYAMHPTVLHEDSKLISGDFPYYTRRWLQQRALPATCPVVYHNGASGNQSPRHVTRANTFAEAQRLGESLGQAIADVIPTLAYRREVQVTCRRQLIDLQIKDFPDSAVAREQVRQARERFEHLIQTGAARQAVRTAECDVFGTEETAELVRAAADGRLKAAAAGALPAEIQVIAIEPWKFVAWPGEFFVEYALAVKARSPDTFVVTLANGDLQGYIVTAEAASKGGYEASNAVFSHLNGPRFVEASLGLLETP
ncbi:MAG: hypothetical protein EXS39_05400 [Opitutaceae bacterium]|nr:hypothetical protein [Opitutaceae bacterium]